MVLKQVCEVGSLLEKGITSTVKGGSKNAKPQAGMREQPLAKASTALRSTAGQCSKVSQKTFATLSASSSATPAARTRA